MAVFVDLRRKKGAIYNILHYFHPVFRVEKCRNMEWISLSCQRNMNKVIKQKGKVYYGDNT